MEDIASVLNFHHAIGAFPFRVHNTDGIVLDTEPWFAVKAVIFLIVGKGFQ